MSEKMTKIKRDIEKKRRQKKHAKQILVFVAEFLTLIFVFTVAYFSLVFASVIINFILK